jgi:three-Cys-motif partner protein
MSGKANVQVFQGDCNVVIPSQVLRQLPRRAPSLAFLDPTGAQLHWSTVEALAAHRLGPNKMELLILYPYDMFIARWLKLPAMAPVLTTMFGGSDWQRALQDSIASGENGDARRLRFVNVYLDRLRSLNYRYVKVYGPLYSGHRPLYHIIFASDHPAGAKIMEDVWGKTKPFPGGLGYQYP